MKATLWESAIHGILAVGKDRLEVTKETIAAMMDDDSEVSQHLLRCGH